MKNCGGSLSESENKAHNKDCIEYLSSVPDETYDLCIADPPYFRIHGDFDFGWESLDAYLKWCHLWITECHRTLKNDGAFYLWGKIGFGKGFALFKIADWFESENLFTIRNWITQRNTRGRGNKKGFMEAREELIFATKSDKYIWNPAYTSEKSTRTDLGADGKPRKNQYKRVSDVWIDIAEASQSSKQRFGLSTGEKFPTVKSLDLCARIIGASSDEGDHLFIPFGGSGSEAVAAQKMGRKWTLTELDQSYFDEIILPRLAEITPSNP
jgi:site-specific DNA-methyltransferase (adenine-specific)